MTVEKGDSVAHRPLWFADKSGKCAPGLIHMQAKEHTDDEQGSCRKRIHFLERFNAKHYYTGSTVVVKEGAG